MKGGKTERKGDKTRNKEDNADIKKKGIPYTRKITQNDGKRKEWNE